MRQSRYVVLGLVVALTSGVHAEARESHVGIAAGAVDPDGVRTAVWTTANLRWRIGSDLLIQPEIGYWKKSESTTGVESSVEDMSAGLTVLRPLRRKAPRTQVYFGIGASAHVIRSEIEVIGYDTASETEIKYGLNVIGEIEHRVSRAVRFFGGIRSDLVADLNQSKLYGGFRFGR